MKYRQYYLETCTTWNLREIKPGESERGAVVLYEMTGQTALLLPNRQQSKFVKQIQ